MEHIQVDLMGPNGAQGDVAALINANNRLDPANLRPFIGDDGKSYITVYKGGDPKKKESYIDLVTNAAGTLRPYEWRQLDEILLPIAQTRLNGIQDLIDKNLTYNLGNGMGTTVLEWHDISDLGEAVMTMDGITRGQNDRPVYTTNYLPIPIIHADYEINARELMVSRNMGNPLDTTAAERAVRRVAEKLEAMLFTDTTYKFGGGQIWSYLNFEHRNAIQLDSKWTNSGVTGKDILLDVMEMKQTSIAAKKYGPWMLYIPTAYEYLMDLDYSDDKGTNTIRERIMKIGNIQGVKIIDTLTADNVLLVQMTADTVRLVRGMGIQNLQWGVEGNLLTKYKVMTIQVPQLRADQDGNCGIVHATFKA